MKHLLVCAFVAGLSAVSAPSEAQTSDVIVGGWRISQAIPRTCQAITRIDSRLIINVILVKSDRRGYFFLQSNVWRLEEGEKFTGEVSTDGWATVRQAQFNGGKIEDDGLLSFAIDASQTEATLHSEKLSVKIPELYIAADIPIREGTSAYSALEQCLSG